MFDQFVQQQELLVRWLGDFWKLEACDGGLFAVEINGAIIRGTFVKVERPCLIEIAWGEAATKRYRPGPHGSSTAGSAQARWLKLTKS